MADMLSESFRQVRGNSRVREAITWEQSGRKRSAKETWMTDLISPDRNSPVIGKSVKPHHKIG